VYGSCNDWDDRVEIGLVVGLNSWRSRERSCGGRAWSSSGRKQVVYKPAQAVGRAWSGNLGDRDDRVDLIGSVNLALANVSLKHTTCRPIISGTKNVTPLVCTTNRF